jgi:hypothetical protein
LKLASISAAFLGCARAISALLRTLRTLERRLGVCCNRAFLRGIPTGVSGAWP